jgi:DNA polymerase-3 subunit gamma/tau
MVLALKYRPKKFSEVIGQEATIKTLMSSLAKDRLANAYLFSGLRGSGKTSTARIFAKALQCSERKGSEPCESCENCIMANENRHIDIIEMDAASNRKIEDVKELIEHTRYKPTIGKYKVFIIDEVHMLTREAFNALLKTLEEPPEYVKFILATTDPLKLPSTILSRTQHYRFTKIDSNLIQNHLKYILAKEGVPFEDKAVELLAKSGNGSLRDTITLLEQAVAYSKGNVTLDIVVEMLGVVNPEIIEQLFNLVLEGKKGEVREFVHQIADYDIESIFDEIIFYLKDALFHNSFSLITIERFFKIVADMKELLKINVDNEFVLNLMLFKMIEASKPYKIDDLIAQYEREIKNYSAQKKVQSTPISNNNSITSHFEPKSANTGKEKFEKVVAILNEKDKEVGECFKKIKFISYENGVLTWESCVDESCKKLLSRFWNLLIKLVITDIFGTGIKIDYKKCSEMEKKVIEKEEDKKEKPVKENKMFEQIKEEQIKREISSKIYEVFGEDNVEEINVYKSPLNKDS